MDYQRLKSDEVLLLKLLSSYHFLRLKYIHPIILESICSTQAFMQDEIRSAREGDLVISRVQIKGRGREGRSWVSQKGGLWMTLTLRPPTLEVLGEIPLIATESIAKTLGEFGLKGCIIKPPNDVFCHDKKIAGVLSDASVQGKRSIVCLGIGINVNNDPSITETISNIATSLAREIGMEVDLNRFTVSLLVNIDYIYDSAISRKA